MKKLAFLLFAIFYFAHTPPLGAQPPIPLATGEWAPFTSQNSPQQGVVTMLVRDIFKRMGREPEISFYPWKRCYNLVVQGKVWAAFPYSWTRGRAKEVLFSEPMSYSDTGWFYVGEPPVPEYKKLEDLKGLRIAGVVGYFYKEALDKAGLHVEYAPDEASVFRMLFAGRVDLAPMNLLVAHNIIEEHFPDKKGAIKQLKGLYSRNDLRLIVSPDYPESKKLLEAFNNALAEYGMVSPGANSSAKGQ